MLPGTLLGPVLKAVTPYATYIRLGLTGLCMVGCGVAGWHEHDVRVYQPHLAKDTKAALKIEEQARRIEQNATTISTKWHQKLDTKQENTRVVTQTILKAIPAYLPAPVNQGSGGSGADPGRGGYPGLPLGAVLLHDYAASGVPAPVPPASGIDLKGPSGVDLSQGMSTIVTNYGQCLEWRSEVETWRGWYNEQALKWGKVK